MEKHTYNLEKLKRLLNFPFRLKEIGWMPEHVYIHRQTLINRIFVCLTFNFKAGGISEVNGRLVHSSGKDRLGIIWPGTVLQTIQAREHDEIFFTYDASCAEAFRNLGLNSMDGIRITKSVENIIEEIRLELKHLYRPGTADRLDQLAIRLFTELLIEFRAGAEERHRINLKIHDIASWLVSHLHEKINLTALVKEYGFSRRTFYREWGKLYQLSPVRFLLEQRMKLAEELLIRSECSVGEIVEQCGFVSSIYFYQRFRMKHRCSPLQYRRRGRTGFTLQVPVPAESIFQEKI